MMINGKEYIETSCKCAIVGELSSDGYPGHIYYPVLNGVPLVRPTAFNTEEGWALCLSENEEGKLILDSANACAKSHIVEGKIAAYIDKKAKEEIDAIRELSSCE